MKRLFRLSLFSMILFSGLGVWAHNGIPSIQDTVASIVDRLRQTYDPEGLEMLSKKQVMEFITPEERKLLGATKLFFTVDVPVTISIIRDERLEDEPFWLEDREFKKTDLKVKVDSRTFDVWEKDFEPGEIGLGVDSISGKGEAYFIAIRGRNGEAVQVREVYPALHSLGTLEPGVEVYFDDGAKIVELPESLKGQILLRGSDDRKEDAQLVGGFRRTPYSSSERPDHLVLTWSEDPQTTQTLQWRTSPLVKKGVVAFMKKDLYQGFKRGEPTLVEAESNPLVTPFIANDPRVIRHTAVLRDLDPGTSYVYWVGDGSDNGWSGMAEFTTAPDREGAFSFVYMGDAQNGLERWGSLVRNAFRARPDAAFYVMAGDLINRGAERDDWDTFFENAQTVFNQRPLVPCLGNHEYHGGGPELYLAQLALPTGGCKEIGPERSYSFEYSNALFVVLDSNLEPQLQAEWLEDQLKNTRKTWKFVVYHHPAYSSGPARDNPEVREVWGAIFDKYHVDLALQGHDHAYLRTYPMKAGQRVETAKDGTIYIVSVSGTKFYDQDPRDYTEHGMTRVATYQVLDIQVSGDRLVYRAHDIDGVVKDEFVIEK